MKNNTDKEIETMIVFEMSGVFFTEIWYGLGEVQRELTTHD